MKESPELPRKPLPHEEIPAHRAACPECHRSIKLREGEEFPHSCPHCNVFFTPDHLTIMSDEGSTPED